MHVVQASNGCKLFSRSHALLASAQRSSSMAGWPIVLSKHMQTLAMACIRRVQAWYESERKNARAVLSLLCHRFFCRFVEGALAASKISKRESDFWNPVINQASRIPFKALAAATPPYLA